MDIFFYGIDFLPTFLLKPLIHVATYLNVNIGLDIPQLGLDKNTVGHYMLMNIGDHGLQQRMAPHIPQMKTFCNCCIGKVEQKPVVVDDKIVVQEMMNTT